MSTVVERRTGATGYYIPGGGALAFANNFVDYVCEILTIQDDQLKDLMTQDYVRESRS